VYSLSTDAKLDENCMADMIAAGYSRVLVYSGDNVANVRGYLQVHFTLNFDGCCFIVRCCYHTIAHTVGSC
jgi:CBS domain containing-hemolysin-like protein